ncbi:uncharacterized protein LOC110465414 [Mizuhopecten yessoensis]|uniref:Uncharacterized protein n=1 Tax=Mizuhopecten yessoensis TaxID=6573 RepID=A0A210R226_MIZYE|nr:uncharacterized protein LOC110465414 [Mizuhopecten yessoensis]OWF54994.1 hypothetical protein KP79_PYT12936 [Mizuhopecten yessoensis]
MAQNLAMKKSIFQKLDLADANLAWQLVGSEVVKLFAGEHLIPIPSFSSKRSPCAPGFVALRKERTFKEWVFRRPQNFLLTEFLWDFHPSWDNKQRILHSSSKQEDTDANFVYERSLINKGQSKTIRVVLKGKEKSSLDEMPGEMTLDLENFEDSYFDDLDIFLVDTVYSCDSGFLEVTIDGDTSQIEFTARFPIGFKFLKLDTGYGPFPRKVRRIKPIKAEKWKGVWLDRTHYKHALHQIMPNQNKYGGGAGDVLGMYNTPFNLND